MKLDKFSMLAFDGLLQLAFAVNDALLSVEDRLNAFAVLLQKFADVARTDGR